MPASVLRSVSHQLGLIELGSATDAALLTRYTHVADEAAFVELLRRHGPGVLGVCRRMLGDVHDVDDAFQATFLVLAIKASCVQPPSAIGAWLHGVAVNVARKAKRDAARRGKGEMIHIAAIDERETQMASIERAELCTLLDEELARLPRALREAVIVCDVNGRTRAEAAAELGWPEGTVAARLHRARRKLQDRLTRRGITVAAGGLAVVLTPETVTADLTRSTEAAICAYLGSTKSTAFSSAVRTLADGVIRTMFTGKHALSVLAIASIVLTAGGLLWASIEVNSHSNVPFGGTAAIRDSNSTTHSIEPGPWHQDAVLTDAKDTIFSVAFSPDGKWFAAGGDYSGTGCTWHFPSLERIELYTRDDVHRDPAAISYSPDGKRRVTTCRDGVYWSAAQGRLLPSGLLERGAIPRAVAYGPFGEAVDGKQLNRLAYTDGRTLWAKQWYDDAPVSGAQFGPLKDPPKVEGTLPAAVAYSPDGKQLVFIPNHKIDPDWLSGKSKTQKEATHWFAQVWGAGSGAPMVVLPHGTAPVTAVAWSHNSKLIATGGADGNVLFWDTATHKEVRRVSFGKATIHGLAFAPEDKCIAVCMSFREGKQPNRVDLVNPADGKRIQEITSFPQTPPRAVAFSPDGKTMIVGCGLLAPERANIKWNDDKTKIGAVHVFTTDTTQSPAPW